MSEIKENLYEIVRKMQGPKHPFYNYDELEKCADDIADRLKKMGLKVKEQVFHVKGDERSYRNIIGYWDEIKPDCFLIGSHYDTVPFSPGANDNLSAVAISLELARLFSLEHTKPNICFAFFTLEEGHPGYFAYLQNKLIENRMVDENGNFTSLKLLELANSLQKFIRSDRQGKNIIALVEEFIKQGAFSDREALYLRIRKDSYEAFDKDSPAGKGFWLWGSRHFVEEMHELIGKAIVMDCMGWVEEAQKAHSIIPLNGLENYITTYQADPYETNANYILMLADCYSHDLLDDFHKHCSTPGSDFPNVSGKLPFPVEVIEKVSPDTLRSDHAPFWEKKIPALFVTDSANFRSLRYHTPADTCDAINYDFLARFVESLFELIIKNNNIKIL